MSIFAIQVLGRELDSSKTWWLAPIKSIHKLNINHKGGQFFMDREEANKFCQALPTRFPDFTFLAVEFKSELIKAEESRRS